MPCYSCITWMCPILSKVGFANLQCPDAYTLMNCPLHHCPASFGFFSGLWLSTPVFTHIPDSKLLPLLCLPCTSPSAFFLGFPLWSLAPVSQQLASYLSRFASVNESKSDRLPRFTVISGDVSHWASESREAFGLGDWWAGFLFLPNQEIWLPALFQNKSPVPYQWARLDFRAPFFWDLLGGRHRALLS